MSGRTFGFCRIFRPRGENDMNTYGILLRMFLGLSVLGTACSRDTMVGRDADGCVVLDLDEALRSAPKFKLSDIVSSIEYVPLETSDSCLLPGVCFVNSITDDYILVSDLDQAPYLFDRQGKFLNRIGRRGRGPGEIHRYICGGCIDPETKEVTVFLNGLYTMRFDIRGNFLSEDQLSIRKFHPGETGYRSPHISLYDHKGNGNRTFYFHFNADSTRIFMSDTHAMEETFERLPGMYGVAYEAKPYKNFLGYNNIHYQTNYYPSYFEGPDYLGYFDGSIGSGRYYRFYYDDGHVENPFRIKFSKTYPERGLNIMFMEVGDYIFMGVTAPSLETYFFMYDTRNGQLFRSENLFENDVDDGFDFFPCGCTPDGRHLWGIAFISDLKKQAETSDNPKFRAFADSMAEDANPIIIYGKLKRPFLKE